jgi:hypothetical protein
MGHVYILYDIVEIREMWKLRRQFFLRYRERGGEGGVREKKNGANVRATVTVILAR